MATRLSLDLGSSSLGWALFELEEDERGRPRPVGLIDLGVRLFTDGRDPKAGESLGKLRREPKAMRRNRDRRLQRRRHLLALLTEAGLLPPEGQERDTLVEASPYELRAKAAQEEVSLHQLGRIVWQLHQRRGFKSNRKADNGGKKDDDDSGKIAMGAERLRTLLREEGHSTVGAFMAERQQAVRPEDRDPVRIRLNGQGAKASYEFYPQRAMLEEEFEIIWAKQAERHPELKDELKERIGDALFFQRPLKPVLPGRCTFYPDEYRMPRSRELAQEFVVLSQLGSLRIDASDGERPLFPEEREKLSAPLIQGKRLTWNQVRKALGIGGAARINLQDGGEKALYSSPLPGRFEGNKKKPGAFPDGWFNLDEKARAAIIERLDPAPKPGGEAVATPEIEELEAWAKETLGLDEEHAAILARTTLPDGHLNLSEKAVREIVPHLRAAGEDGFVRTYSDAAKAAGIDHSDLSDGEWFSRLPPYNQVSELQRHIGFGTGNPEDPPDLRYGRFANPTVHIALNQLRRVVNALIDLHGAPDEIVIEVARELKQSQKQKDEAKKRNEINRKANDRRRLEMTEGGHIQEGQSKIRDKLLRMRLWEELGPFGDRKCPYTGEQISLTRLLSDAVEIEHILPFSRTLDDSPANKTVSLLGANRVKRNLTPAEAAERHPDTFDIAAMKARARTMPPNKRWRFDEDAMERYREEENGFVSRQLHATGHLAKLSRSYLSKLFPPENDQGERQVPVWVVTGQLTAKLRAQWGLNLGDHNRKNRDDHRHHAVDAAVIGVIDRPLLQEVATLSGRAKEKDTDVDRLIAGLAEPYDGYIDEVQEAVGQVLVVPRANHGRVNPNDPYATSGKLHEETNYGPVRDLPENEADLAIGNVVRRKPVVDLTPKEIGQVRDSDIRRELEALLKETGKEKKALAAALADWSEETRTRRVRVLKPAADAVPIHNKKTGAPYRYVVPAENAWLDVIETPDGKWKARAVDIFAANTGRSESYTDLEPGSKLIMRLRKGDTVQLFDEDGENRVKRVVRLEPSAGRVRLAAVNEGGDLSKRHDDKDDSFRWDFATISKMKHRRARRVRFTPAGRMKVVSTERT